MPETTKHGFWKRRWEAFLDNLIWWVVLFAVGAFVAGVGGAAVFGSSDVALPLWLIVLFGFVQLGCVGAIVLLLIRSYRPVAPPIEAPAEPPPPPPHPHRALLGRIDALAASAAATEPMWPVESQVALTFNRILEEAKAATPHRALNDIEPFEERRDGSGYVDANYGMMASLLGQIRAVVNDAG
jgi:hypothetical protein